jgi:hypothetical protein
MRRILLSGLLSLLFADCAGAAVVHSYHIGNSLTNVALNGSGPGLGLPALAASVGDTSDIGYQIKCSDGLEAIWYNPTTTCVAPNQYGYFQSALANNKWDAVSFQPYYDPQARLYINNMAGSLRSNPANAQTKLYVYESWPQYLGTDDYSATWQAPYTSGIYIFQRNFFEDLTKQLRTDQGPNVFLVPTAEVLFRIDQLAKAGQVPGITSVKDWYIDAGHLNGNGELLASETLYATMFGKNPSAIPTPPGGVSPEIKAIIDREVWAVVNGNPLTGVGVPEPATSLGLASFAFVACMRRRSRR